jgi:hypothetical protein
LLTDWFGVAVLFMVRQVLGHGVRPDALRGRTDRRFSWR